MILHTSECPGCGSRKRVRAVNLSAVIYHGALIGEEEAKICKQTPLQYDLIDFCGNATCERVFRAVRKNSKAAEQLEEVKVLRVAA